MLRILYPCSDSNYKTHFCVKYIGLSRILTESQEFECLVVDALKSGYLFYRFTPSEGIKNYAGSIILENLVAEEVLGDLESLKGFSFPQQTKHFQQVENVSEYSICPNCCNVFLHDLCGHVVDLIGHRSYRVNGKPNVKTYTAVCPNCKTSFKDWYRFE